MWVQSVQWDIGGGVVPCLKPEKAVSNHRFRSGEKMDEGFPSPQTRTRSSGHHLEPRPPPPHMEANRERAQYSPGMMGTRLSDQNGWFDSDPGTALTAFQHSCRVLMMVFALTEAERIGLPGIAVQA